jgi:hypothetical protein
MRHATITIVISMLVAGCTADLKRVHSPELQAITPRQAQKWAGATASRPIVSETTAPGFWQLHSSLSSPDSMRDGILDTISVAPDPSMVDQYILVDLGQTCLVNEVEMLHPPGDGYPRRYRIDVSGEHNFPYELRFVGEGKEGCSTATLRKPVRCRFLRITLLERCDSCWAVSELQVR